MRDADALSSSGGELRNIRQQTGAVARVILDDAVEKRGGELGLRQERLIEPDLMEGHRAEPLKRDGEKGDEGSEHS